MEDAQKTILFEKTPIPAAVAKLSIPMVFSSLVMVLYNMPLSHYQPRFSLPLMPSTICSAWEPPV